MKVRTVLERTAFAVDREEIAWARVVDHARRSGAWAAVEATAREGVACLAADVAAGQAPSRSVVRDAAAAWRTGRRLTAAEDMETWLRRWDLEVPLFFDHVRRTLARGAHPDDAAELADAHPFGDFEQLERQVWATAACSGTLDRAARELASASAIRARLVADGAAQPDEDLDETTDRFRRLVVTPDAVDREFLARRLEWVRVDGDLLVFASADAAREGRLCLADDGITPAELAATPGIEHRRQRWFVDDLPANEQPELLAAQPGDVLGPFVDDGAFRLLAVNDRVLPSLDASDIRQRAEQAVWSRALTHVLDEHVTWPTGR